MLSIVNFVDKSVAIPEQRFTLVIRGQQGYGKSTLAGAVVKELLKSGQFKAAYLYVHPKKLEETLPKYPAEIIVPETSFTVRWIEKYHDCIVVVEDAMRLDERQRRALLHLVSFLARAHRIFTIEVTQSFKKDYEPATEVICKWNDGRFFYRICQNKVWTDDIEWTCHSEPNCKPLIDALRFGITKGVPKTCLGKPGRPVNQESKKQRAFKLFEAGKSNLEVAAILGLRPSVVRAYRYQWREEKRWEELNKFIHA